MLNALRRTRGLCVFDLDSTLLDNRPRQALILREYGRSVGEPALLAVGPEHFDGWDLEVAMRNAGISAERALAWRDPARRFWKERFFTNEYCRFDVPIQGAVDFVREVGKLGAIAYLTGRHAGMREGTLASLGSAGFPLPGAAEVYLLLKPTQEMHDDLWKEQACAQVRALGRVVAAFDNEPAHINRYRELFDGALCIHLETDHSGRPIQLAPGIVSIPNFLR
ncbi:MAG: HAD family hydrolase [Myxococcales bacterium]